MIESKTAGEVKGGQYRFSRMADGTYTIYDVPIVGEIAKHERFNETPIDRKWLERAVAFHAVRMAEEYLPPSHVHHHGDGAGRTERAGRFIPRRLGRFTLGGVEGWHVFADLVAIPESIFNQIQSDELGYRSVELPPVHLWATRQEILSLAFLPDEAPHFKYPLLTLGAEVAPELVITFSDEHETDTVRGYRTTESTALVLMRNRFSGVNLMEGDEKKDEEKPKMMDEAAMEAMIVAVLKKHGVLKDEAEKGEDKEKAKEKGEEDMASTKADNTDMAPAEQPAGAKTSKAFTAETVKLRARVEALESKESARGVEKTAAALVEAVIAEKLSDYKLSDKTRAFMLDVARTGDKEKLAAFADVYAEEAEREKPETLSDYERGAGRRAKMDSPEVAKFSARGPEQLAAARAASAQYDQLKERGYDIRASRESFINTQIAALNANGVAGGR